MRAATSRPRQQARRLVSCAASSLPPSLFDGLGTAGAAIELRSRLQATQLESQRKGGQGGGGDGVWTLVDGGAWVLRPPGRAFAVCHFIGGAVLGAYPQIVYDATLRALSFAGFIIVATPYDVALDHGTVALACGASLSEAVQTVVTRDAYGKLPLFGFGHSLGAKLLLLLACSNASGAPAYEAQAFVAFNNASAADSVRLVEAYARELLAKRAAASPDQQSAVFDSVLRAMPALGAMAERVATSAGYEFTPNPGATMDAARSRFAPRRALLVSYASDTLDQNASLRDALLSRTPSSASSAASASQPPAVLSPPPRPGNHLSPVVVKLEAGASPLGDRVGALSFGDVASAEALGRDVASFFVNGKL